MERKPSELLQFPQPITAQREGNAVIRRAAKEQCLRASFEGDERWRRTAETAKAWSPIVVDATRRAGGSSCNA